MRIYNIVNELLLLFISMIVKIMYKESLNNWKYINFKTNYMHKNIIFVHESIKFSLLLTICRIKVVAQILYSHIFSNFTTMIKKKICCRVQYNNKNLQVRNIYQFQLMASAPNNSSLLSNQDINWFFV